MKKPALLMIFILLVGLFCGCQTETQNCQIAATTLPVYEFTSRLCDGTGLRVCQIITQNVSCLHDYTLQAAQMQLIEAADTLVISGVGLEDFQEDALSSKNSVIDASTGINLLCSEQAHNHSHDHNHDQDPHIWLSPANAKVMANNIFSGLTAQYPQYEDIFSDNYKLLLEDLNNLQSYGTQTLCELSCRELVTFHDGFSYFAKAFDLSILKAVEEDSGSEASAAELKELINLVESNNLPAIFTEVNGSESSAKTICAETGAALYSLDMAISGKSYFNAMYHNIDTLKEALG